MSAVLEKALELEGQRANDLELARDRWKETAARQEKLHAAALDKIDFWRRRSAELEAKVDDLTEKMCDAIEHREELAARVEWLEDTILGDG